MTMEVKLDHYYICNSCAQEKGGVLPDGHVCTVTEGQCPYCKTDGVVLIPWVDFNWPKDKKVDKVAKGNRD